MLKLLIWPQWVFFSYGYILNVIIMGWSELETCSLTYLFTPKQLNEAV